MKLPVRSVVVAIGCLEVLAAPGGKTGNNPEVGHVWFDR